ncbi:hypothetical protein [Salinifilum ghardaiensis]
MAFRDAKNADGRTRRVADLEYDIAESRRLRPLLSDPDHVAVVMQRHARRTLTGLWIFLCLGLVFTTTGVQRFLAGDTAMDDPLWWAAWCVEPMFAGLLVTLLNFEAVILSHGVKPEHAWWGRLKHTLLASTLAMNVIPQLAPLLGEGVFNLGSLAVHAIVPIIVYGVAEVIPVIQARTRQIIHQVNDQAAAPVASGEPVSADAADSEDAPPSVAETAPRSPSEPASLHYDTSLQRKVVGVDDASTTTETTPQTPTPARPDVGDLAAVRSLKLPESVVAKLREVYQGAAAQGREITTADVQQAVKLPDAMAQRIVTELTGHNGHPVATP